ncbi:hypothetical protein N7495_000293 [Penicillium taxi]|uniref:uncharacterized protein n=1 Tax=Penicillium taxi TaxID=168475 RepID=UPI0025456F4D|nr:uncharacterized protein N7495_000293 [Penicillium taxi]KAJ5907611.1 hypothetical protein N7495_000293 [Penicillium taxi]
MEPSKRARVSSGSSKGDDHIKSLISLHRSISPPTSGCSKRSRLSRPSHPVNTRGEKNEPVTRPCASSSHLIPSPIQLTHIKDLSDRQGFNVDTVQLRDILGDPMISECWQFNFLFDVDFLMSQFDSDVQHLVKVKVVHGSWQRESQNRIIVEEACSRWSNVEPIIAYMPEPFGTHHTKMMILFRHDDLAQVIIHTANMIQGDWQNMTQAVWKSPLLPLEKPNTSTSAGQPAFGTGRRFKRDIMSYLKAYGSKKTGTLVKQLSEYDFSVVRAAFLASIPSKQQLNGLDSNTTTLWGWPALNDIMGNLPLRQPMNHSNKAQIVIQVSSVASLGVTDKWLKDVFFKALSPGSINLEPNYSIIFPTPEEIRHSLDGYGSGGSIHMKIQSDRQKRQLNYMRSHLCHWDSQQGSSQSKSIDLSEKSTTREAGRSRAAPHIKTYIRFSDPKMDTIDWAIVTSANLSTQAWGAGANTAGEVRISSFEVGVVVWPDLFTENTKGNAIDPPSILMVPCFKRDTPIRSLNDSDTTPVTTVVGLRMPYDLPLTPYGDTDEPWCASAPHELPDWQGRSWVI